MGSHGRIWRQGRFEETHLQVGPTWTEEVEEGTQWPGDRLGDLTELRPTAPGTRM